MFHKSPLSQGRALFPGSTLSLWIQRKAQNRYQLDSGKSCCASDLLSVALRILRCSPPQAPVFLQLTSCFSTTSRLGLSQPRGQLYPYRIRVTDKGGIFFVTLTPVVRTDLVVTGRSSSTLRTPSFVHGGNFPSPVIWEVDCLSPRAVFAPGCPKCKVKSDTLGSRNGIHS